MRKKFFLGNNKLINLFFISSFFLFFAFLILAFLKFNFTGKIILNLPSSNIQNISGNLVLKIKPGELLPNSTILKIEGKNQKKEISLSNLINLTPIYGKYYLENFNLSGEGESYGFIGKKIIYPEINFKFIIKKSENFLENSSNKLTESNISSEQNQEQISNDQLITNNDEQTTEKTISEIINNLFLFLTPTGKTIDSNNYKEFQGKVSKENPFIYELNPDETFELIPESVKYKNSSLKEDVILIKKENNKIIINTNYRIEESGFGEEYLEGEEKEISIPLSTLNLTFAEENYFTFTLENNNEILSFPYSIKIESLPILQNQTSLINFSLDFINQTSILKDLTNETDQNLTIQTIQYSAIIGQPVKWKKIINKSKETNLTIGLPKNTFNVKVYKLKNETRERIDNKKLKISQIKKNISLKDQNQKKEILEEELSNVTQIEINDNSTNLEIEYYTEPPLSSEKDITNGKQILISAPDELNYTNISAYTSLNKNILISDFNKIHLYWLTNINKEKKLEKIQIPFTPFDKNKDGFIDYIEWVIPHLSNQTYELIIETKDAEHLDENKILIGNIYEYIKEKDNNWITIPDNHYLRLQFEKNLTNYNDITIYAKSSNETSSKIEIYEKNKDKLIAKFDNITNENYYKIYLSDLINPQDSFDLKISNSVDFDFVVDPVNLITINNPKNTSDNLGSTLPVNISITGTSIDSCLASLDNQENITMLLNDDKTSANYTYTNVNPGYHNLTIYCNDSSNLFYSTNLLNFFVNLPPNVTSITLYPDKTDANQNLICNFTISDDNPVIIWGENNRLENSPIYSIYCDNDFCYAVDTSGYFLKLNKTSGVHIYNRTTGYTNQLSTSSIYSIYCDNDFCYAVDDPGYFLKLNKTSGVHIYNRTTGYTNQLSTSSIYSIYCDNDFCYAVDTSGYFLKLNKTQSK